MEFTLLGAFANSAFGDYVIVDIPYLTEALEVEIKSANTAKRVLLARKDEKGQTIDAYGEMMDMYDHHESQFQTDRAKQVNDMVIWESEDPKLGYRYWIWFRTV
jgi:hypothetical protein